MALDLGSATESKSRKLGGKKQEIMRFTDCGVVNRVEVRCRSYLGLP